MFTGIIEDLAEIIAIEEVRNNLRIRFSCSFTNDLSIDQSVSHDGVCLTVVDIQDGEYSVDVIAETLSKTTIGEWSVGDLINLERSVTMQKRLDGHIVQGHVDTTVSCKKISDEEGSKRFWFSYPKKWASYLIPKGSISVNGVSLTIADLTHDQFSVAIIPYTYTHTNFHQLQIGSKVNIEFDLVGKYINRIQQLKN